MARSLDAVGARARARGSASWPATARGWKPFSQAWSKACSCSTTGPGAARERGRTADARHRRGRRRPPLHRVDPPSRRRRRRSRARSRANSRPASSSPSASIRRVFIARATPARDPTGGGAVLVLHDITDLKRADQVRRDFVANVSHELRTPLTAIRGYVETLLEEVDGRRGGAVPAGHLPAHDAHGASRRRPAAARPARRRAGGRRDAAGDLRALVDGVIDELAPLIDNRRADVRVSIDDPEAGRSRPIRRACTTSSATCSRTR